MESRVHGTEKGWQVLGCRKECCFNAHNAYRVRLYRLRKIQGTFTYVKDQGVPRQEVADYIKKLRDSGHTLRSITVASGVPLGTLKRICNEPGYYTYTHVAEKIFSVLPKDVPCPVEEPWMKDCFLVDSTGARRRFQALVYRGFTAPVISRYMGVSPRTVQRTLTGEYEHVLARVHRSVRDVFPHMLLLEEPKGDPANRARARARFKGWLPAGAWSNLDDPNCRPESLNASKRSRR